MKEVIDRTNNHIEFLSGRASKRLLGEHGVSELEVAVVLIGLVVAASVLAFAFLTTLVIGSTNVREESRVRIEQSDVGLLVGNVLAIRHPTDAHLTSIRFEVTTASKGASGVDFSDARLALRYIDDNQAVVIPRSSYGTKWLFGDGEVLDPGERLELEVELSGLLSTDLGAGTKFSIEIILPTSNTVVSRVTPAELSPVVYMR